MKKHILDRLLLPANHANEKASAIIALFILTVSALSLLAAPMLMPESYSWVTHTTSESAAQGLEGAWLTRLGFLLFGLAVIRLSAIRISEWPQGAVWMHTSFGVFMVAAAVFSHKPWMSGMSLDPIEDTLHSIAATAIGFAFAFGVLARLLQRRKLKISGQIFDAVAIGASIFIPLLMVSLPMRNGLLQRIMFLIAYIWYGNEMLQDLIRDKKNLKPEYIRILLIT